MFISNWILCKFRWCTLWILHSEFIHPLKVTCLNHHSFVSAFLWLQKCFKASWVVSIILNSKIWHSQPCPGPEEPKLCSLGVRDGILSTSVANHNDTSQLLLSDILCMQKKQTALSSECVTQLYDFLPSHLSWKKHVLAFALPSWQPSYDEGVLTNE